MVEFLFAGERNPIDENGDLMDFFNTSPNTNELSQKRCSRPWINKPEKNAAIDGIDRKYNPAGR